jgi:ribose transport system substrate-binding protein
VKKFLVIVGLVVLAALFVVVGLLQKGPTTREANRPAIAVVPKGTTHDFWNAVRAGAERAGHEGGVEILWNGPEREGDRERQIQIVEDFIVRRVAGIVLAPSDAQALIPVVERATAADIPVVIIDSDIQTDQRVSFVATDNFGGGALAARRMAAQLGEQGRVAVMKYMAGSASTTARENGFMQTIRSNYPNIQIVEDRYGQDTVETALSAAEDMLTRHSELNGIFACNESTARGALRALENQGRAGQITMIGFDTSEPLLQGLRAGRVNALVVQNPFAMGEQGVRIAVAAFRGGDVPPRIDTGVALVTAQNIDEPAMQSLLNPGS